MKLTLLLVSLALCVPLSVFANDCASEKMVTETDKNDCLELAVNELGDKTSSDAEKADGLSILESLCSDHHDAESCRQLSIVLWLGLAPGKQDRARAFEMAADACEADDVFSCTNEGYFLVQDSPLRDDKRGVKLLKQSCPEDRRGACHVVGVLYVEGRGVPADLNKALIYLKLACDAGNKISCSGIEQIEKAINEQPKP